VSRVVRPPLTTALLAAAMLLALGLTPATGNTQEDSATSDVESRRELARAKRRAAGWVEPAVGGSRDSDGISTWFTGIGLASADFGRARVLASAGRGVAGGDALPSRGSFDARVGTILRPVARMSLEINAGVHRVDRTFIDTTGSGPGPGNPGGGRPALPIGRARVGGRGMTELIPVGRARLVWRSPAVRLDARASRQVLDASPYLVAQGVRRDEIGAELDLRVVAKLRVRGFGRAGIVHNEDEANGRRIVGAALALTPEAFDISIRGQELSYGGPTGLAYFAPRYVRTLEVTTYVERELGNVQLALDAGAGAQRVAKWTEPLSSWSPTARLWAQLAKPLTPRVSLGVDGEAYDSRFGTEMPSFEVRESRWRYGSLRIWMRAAM
jgi:hypothetical protein